MAIAAYLVLLSAALHVAGAAAAGFGTGSLILLGPALLFLVLSAGLKRETVGSAWLSLVCLIASSAAALSHLQTASTVPDLVFWAILTVNAAAGLTLFVVIWRGPARAS